MSTLQLLPAPSTGGAAHERDEDLLEWEIDSARVELSLPPTTTNAVLVERPLELTAAPVYTSTPSIEQRRQQHEANTYLTAWFRALDEYSAGRRPHAQVAARTAPSVAQRLRALPKRWRGQHISPQIHARVQADGVTEAVVIVTGRSLREVIALRLEQRATGYYCSDLRILPPPRWQKNSAGHPGGATSTD